ncbi:MAG: Bax inhibitor-1 family protein [Solirubrobacteraceae bacterium]
MSFSRQYAADSRALTRDQTRGVFGQVMGLVALTVGCTALGAYIGRNLTGGTGILFFLAAFACVFGLQFASRRGHEQLAIGLLFGLGLCIGIAVGPVLADYAKADPAALWQAAGSTAVFIGVLGAGGYATRRDLSPFYRIFFWALVALLLFGLVAIFVAIPNANIIYAILGLVVFGGFTVLDFNRLRRADMGSAVPIAAGIFLDIFNVFLFFLSLFGGGGSRR